MTTRRTVLGVATVAATAAAAAGIATATRRWRAADADDPCGPDPLRLPDGEERKLSTADGATIAVTVAGPDDGPVVVLVHGWTNARAVWAPVARRLVDAGHRVVLYDQRGHGASTLGDAGFGLDQLGRDLAQLLTELDLRDAVLAGHSMGGMTIQALAAEAPEVIERRARGIVLVSTGAQVLNQRLARLLVRSDRGPLPGRAGLFMARVPLGRKVRWSHVTATRDMLVACDPEVRRGYLGSMVAMDLRAGLGSITVPTTVVVGRFDALTPVPLSRRLANAIGGAELVVLPDVGHMLPFEAPDRIAELITEKAA